MSDSTAHKNRMLHPLIHKTRIWTEPVIEFCRQVNYLIAVGGESRCFDAVPDSGKSTAIEMAETKVREIMPWMPIYVITVPNHRPNATREFFAYWAEILLNSRAPTKDRDLLRHRIEMAMVEDALRNESPAILTFIDEAQNLQISDLLMLKDLHNGLDRAGIRMVTVSVGQKPFMERSIEKVLKENRTDVVNRFLDHRRRFRDLMVREGKEKECELFALLKTIDELVNSSETPQTWTQSFVPNAWDKGWRLRNEITNLIAGLKRSAFLDEDEEHQTVPIGVVIRAIRAFLTEASMLDRIGLWPPSSPDEKIRCWVRAILPISGAQETND